MAKLDGSLTFRVTKEELYHSGFDVSPDRKWLISQYEAPNTPPCNALYAIDGSRSKILAKSDPADAPQMAELFKFKSSDGEFDIHGIRLKPLGYDPSRKNPVIAFPYGLRRGPTFWPYYYGGPMIIRYGNQLKPNRDYMIVQVNSRGTLFRGRAFVNAAGNRPFTVAAQDYADAIKLLRKRSDVDRDRVGIVGHSFGGGVASMAVLKHPDVFSVAVSKSGVMDFRNQNAIFATSFGMGTFDENAEAYVSESPVTHAGKLKRPLLLMQGLMDTRVYPNSVFMMSDALDAAGVDYDLRVYPRAGHGLGPSALVTQWRFLQRHLLDEIHEPDGNE